MNFAPTITAKSLVALGFIDTTSPPFGVFAAFNQIQGSKEAVPMPDFRPQQHHPPEGRRLFHPLEGGAGIPAENRGFHAGPQLDDHQGPGYQSLKVAVIRAPAKGFFDGFQDTSSGDTAGAGDRDQGPGPCRALARALVEGGLDILEITLRTPAALDAIKAIATEVKGATVGAGTVINAGQFAAAAGAGARFVVSPGLTEEVVLASRDHDVPILPGVATASEIMRGLALGLDTFKFFPAETSGGAPAIKALGRAVSAGAFLSHRRCLAQESRLLSVAAQCDLRRRLLDGAVRPERSRRLRTRRRDGARSQRIGARHDHRDLHRRMHGGVAARR